MATRMGFRICFKDKIIFMSYFLTTESDLLSRVDPQCILLYYSIDKNTRSNEVSALSQTGRCVSFVIAIQTFSMQSMQYLINWLPN